MRNFFLIVLGFLFININTVYSQKFHSEFKHTKIDTLNLFNPIGFIGVASKKNIVPDDSLTSRYLQLFDSVFVSTSKFSTNLLNSSIIQSDSTQKYFVDLMFRLDKLRDEHFFNNRMGETIQVVIKDQPGRYFGIICYSGFVHKHTKGVAITGAVMLTASLLLSGGTFWMTVVPVEPYYNIYFAIIDKEKDCILYYNSYKVDRTPLKIKVIQRSINELLNGMKSRRVTMF